MNEVTGIIRGIEDHGTIVTVLVHDEARGRIYPIHFDHRPFRWMVEGRGGIQNIVGQAVVVRNPGQFSDEVMDFVDELAQLN